jgi:osomolarity two-component system response regulator SSK1
MQALIDFDGWRKWKDYSQDKPENEPKEGKSKGAAKKKNRVSIGSNPSPPGPRVSIKEDMEHEGLGITDGQAS